MSGMSNSRRSKIFNYVVVNGERMLAEQAQTAIFNDALLSSFGVYETVKIDQGRPFYLEDHLQRLHRSAEMIDLKLGVDVPTLARWFDRLIEVDRQASWGLRILALGALSPNRNALIAMQANPLATYPESLYHQGASAVLYEGQRAIPNCKSLNTLVNFLARTRATQAGALEGLLHHNGCITEGSRTNLFAVRAGKLITPPESTILPGITRDIVLDVMRDTDYPVVEETISTDLSQYDEFFISSTSMHVMPITRIEGRPIGNGQVGPVTKITMVKFEAHYEQAIETVQV